MSDTPAMDFGYNPPSGDRGLETIKPRQYPADLHRSLDVATQGFTSLWVSDHLNYADEWRLECWTLLTWIAARYPGQGLGTIVMSNTFRSPALMAKMGASLQELSSGRFILGYGAGWHEGEHNSYGYDFPRPGIRIDMLAEAIQVIRAMWTDAGATFSGEHYRVDDVHCEPRPDPAPPIMIGGAGERRTLRVVAQHADWWNDLPRPTDVQRHKLAVLREHCEAVGRDYDTVRKTITARVFIDRSHSRAMDMAGEWGGDTPIAGDPRAVRDQLARMAELGFDMFIATFPDFQGLGDMRLFMDEVIPAFARP